MNIEERLRDMGRHQPAELPSQNEWDRFRARGTDGFCVAGWALPSPPP